MSDFHERWMRLAAAARRADAPAGELVRLARPRPAARSERNSLLALAALLICMLLALVPWREQVGDFVHGATHDLAALPARVPRPPHPPSGAETLAALLDLTPFTMESQP
jgi:hypothetical protein